MSVPVWKAFVEDGTLEVPDPSFVRWVSKLKAGSYELILRPKKKYRGGQQNRYLWGVVYSIIGEALGYSSEEVHDMCKSHFLVFRPDDGPAKIEGTKDLSTTEFSEYCKKIQVWASQGFPDHETGRVWPELSVYIPDPNEVVK